MKLLFDFFPIVLFFIAYKFYGIYVATGVAIGATLIQVGSSWAIRRKIETMHVITLILIVTLGGATLLLQDDMFIKWKPTVINWLFAVAFLFSGFFSKTSLLQKMMQQNIELPAHAWKKLNLSWVGFFTLMGFVNLYVVYNYDTDTWVNFKLFGMLGLTVVFVILQAIYMTQHVTKTPQKESSS